MFQVDDVEEEILGDSCGFNEELVFTRPVQLLLDTIRVSGVYMSEGGEFDFMQTIKV